MRTRNRFEPVAALALFVFFLLCLSLAGNASAADVSYAWSNPTQYEDNTPLPASDLVEYDFGCSPANDGNYIVVDTFAAASPLQTANTSQLPPGDYWCALRVETANAESTWSNAIFLQVPYPRPKPPSGLSGN